MLAIALGLDANSINYHETLCRKPRGLLTVGLWTPRSIDTTGFLGVILDGGPEIQDEKIDLGVHRVEILTLSLKVLDMECQIRENTSKLLSKRFKTFSLPVYLLISLGSLFQPRGVVVCILACRSQFTKIVVSDFL